MAPIDHVVTSGTFSLDGETHEVDNNVWIVGDDNQAIVIDAAHDAEPIIAALGTRELLGIVCTHGHDDHISAAGALRDITGAPVWLHPADRMLWDVLYHDSSPDRDLLDRTTLSVAGIELTALHTPGHSPGSTCLVAPDLATVFSGDTLFSGGSGGHRAVVLRPADHRGVDPGPPADAARRDRGPYRARRQHVDRGRGSPPAVRRRVRRVAADSSGDGRSRVCDDQGAGQGPAATERRTRRPGPRHRPRQQAGVAPATPARPPRRGRRLPARSPTS
jgi:glyoxylase-like metal-dependent hydrolase (beta-lactamase superfamily II)